MIIVLHSDTQQPEYSATQIMTFTPNVTDEPPPEYSNEPPPEYSNEPPPEYSNEPPPEYSNEPPPEYSNEPPPEYSNEPSPDYSDEPPPEYSNEPPPNHSDEPPPEHSDEPSPSHTDEPPPEYPYESSSNFTDEPPPNYSDLPSPIFSYESPSIYSDEILQNFPDEPPKNFSDERLTIYSGELPPNFSDVLDTSSEFRDDYHELASRQSINTDISAISTQEHTNNNIMHRNEISGSSPISHARLDTSRMGFPIIDIYTLAGSEQNLNSSCTLELNTVYPEAGQAYVYPGETTSQTRNTQNRTVTTASRSIDGNEVKFRCGRAYLMFMVFLASWFCCFTGSLALYYACMKDKYLQKHETNKAKTAETYAIILLIVSYVIICGGICASIGILIQLKYVSLLPIPLYVLIVCIISIWCGYCKRFNQG